MSNSIPSKNPPARSTSERLLAFLNDPASYPHRPPAIRSTQTHISWIFFASPFVFKVKKPVDFGFLDFSSLEKREHSCRREVELNRRLAPEIYCGIVPIYNEGDRFSFERIGQIVDYCVQMKELEDGFFLHQLLGRDLVSEPEINRVISCLHHFYDSETSAKETEGWGTPEKLRITTNENLALAEKFVGQTITAAAFTAIRQYTDNFFAQHSELLTERVRAHRVRDCHGDLRLEHIHLTADRLTIFDCIEFNDRLRFIDVANDLAFLAMDFDFEGRRDLANLFLKSAARTLKDEELNKLTDFYKCYRASVRGKVESLEAESCEQTKEQEHTTRAKRYYRLALRYATFGSKDSVLVVMGGVGTGKSTVARELGNELGWPVFSSDRIRKTLANVPLTQRTGKSNRPRVYSEETTSLTYQTLLQEGLTEMSKTGGVILDATFSRRTHHDLLRAECERMRAQLQIIELEANRTQIATRLKARESRSNEISDARLEDLEQLSTAYEPPTELTDLIRHSTEQPMADTMNSLLLKLARWQSFKND